jgi:putative membrane protein
VSTLVVCLTRGRLPVEPPVVGAAAVERLVTNVGIADPEDSRVNCILEGLRVARELDSATVAVLSRSEQFGGDRDIARQLDGLVDTGEFDAAVVVVDSAEDEQLLPVVESRLTVDAVDRVVVRQARDIESTYYLLKQFLGDEQLRRSVLVPVGLALLAFPALLALSESVTAATGAIAAVFGLLVLLKALRIDAVVAGFSRDVRRALYGGQVSLVTYVVAAGLVAVGGFLGVLGVSSLEATGVGGPVLLVQFVHDAVPWLTGAALMSSSGRLLDGYLGDEELGPAYVNFPFVALAVGLAVRGFTAYVLRVSDAAPPLRVPAVAVGSWEMEGFSVTAGTHLTGLILASIVASLVGVRVAAYVSDPGSDDRIERL